MKRVGVLFTRGAWRGVDAAAGIDAALSVLSFEHQLSVALVGAGVELLIASDDEDERAQRHRMLAALLHHGASSLQASLECVEARSISPHLAGVELIPRRALREWLNGNDHVLCF